MTAQQLMISKWNVRGLGNPERVIQIKKWIRENHLQQNVICLQELKIKEKPTKFHLKMINEEAYIVTDCAEEGKVGSAIIVLEKYKVTARGKK